jgi:hypothetical protein
MASWEHAPSPTAGVEVVQKWSKGASVVKATTEIDCAAERVLAWAIDSTRNERITEDAADSIGLFRREILVPDSRSILSATVQKLQRGAGHRLLQTWTTWRKDPKDGSYLIAFAPIDHFGSSPLVDELKQASKDDPVASKCVRAKVRGFWRISRIAQNVCHIVLAMLTGAGGTVPDYMLKRRSLSATSTVAFLKKKFERSNEEVVSALTLT